MFLLDLVHSSTNNPLKFSNHFIVTKSHVFSEEKNIAMKGFARALLSSQIPSVDAEVVYPRHFMLL